MLIRWNWSLVTTSNEFQKQLASAVACRWNVLFRFIKKKWRVRHETKQKGDRYKRKKKWKWRQLLFGFRRDFFFFIKSNINVFCCYIAVGLCECQTRPEGSYIQTSFFYIGHSRGLKNSWRERVKIWPVAKVLAYSRPDRCENARVTLYAPSSSIINNGLPHTFTCWGE